MIEKTQTPNLWSVKEREKRIKKILAILKICENNKGLVYSALIGELSLEWGLSERKIREYCRVLENSGKIEIEWYEGNEMIIDRIRIKQNRGGKDE